jgi:transposase
MYSGGQLPRLLAEVRRFRLMIGVDCDEADTSIRWRSSMKHYAGLDVLVKETSVCIVDEAGNICRELKVASHPRDLVRLLEDPAWRFARRSRGGTFVAMAV